MCCNHVDRICTGWAMELSDEAVVTVMAAAGDPVRIDVGGAVVDGSKTACFPISGVNRRGLPLCGNEPGLRVPHGVRIKVAEGRLDGCCSACALSSGRTSNCQTSPTCPPSGLSATARKPSNWNTVFPEAIISTTRACSRSPALRCATPAFEGCPSAANRVSPRMDIRMETPSSPPIRTPALVLFGPAILRYTHQVFRDDSHLAGFIFNQLHDFDDLFLFADVTRGNHAGIA